MARGGNLHALPTHAFSMRIPNDIMPQTYQPSPAPMGPQGIPQRAPESHRGQRGIPYGAHECPMEPGSHGAGRGASYHRARELRRHSEPQRLHGHMRNVPEDIHAPLYRSIRYLWESQKVPFRSHRYLRGSRERLNRIYKKNKRKIKVPWPPGAPRAAKRLPKMPRNAKKYSVKQRKTAK